MIYLKYVSCDCILFEKYDHIFTTVLRAKKYARKEAVVKRIILFLNQYNYALNVLDRSFLRCMKHSFLRQFIA